MHTILGHNCMPNGHEFQEREFWQVFRSLWLWFDVCEFSILAEQRVQCFLRQLGSLCFGRRWDELDFQNRTWISNEVLHPWSAPDQECPDSAEGVEPWFDGVLLQVFSQGSFNFDEICFRIVGEFDKSSAFPVTRNNFFDLDRYRAWQSPSSDRFRVCGLDVLVQLLKLALELWDLAIEIAKDKRQE